MLLSKPHAMKSIYTSVLHLNPKRCFILLLFFLMMGGYEKVHAQSSFQKTIGGGGNDAGRSIIRTSDGGYALVGTYDAFGIDSGSVYVVKLNSSGALQWTTAIGQSSYDEGISIVQTSDGGYAITGKHGHWTFEMYVIKLNSSGNLLWSSTINEGLFDYGSSIIETVDGGLLIGGRAHDAFSGYYGLLVKLNAAGDYEWSNTYGDFGDGIYTVVQTIDRGYALAAAQYLPNDVNLILAKTDSLGVIQWRQSVGGNGFDGIRSPNMMTEAKDGGFVLAGSSDSFGAGGTDLYVVKFSSTGSLLWTRTIGGVGDEEGNAVIQTNDLGYLVAGSTNSFGSGNYDAYLAKLDSAGVLQWSRSYGGVVNDAAQDVVQSADSGFVFTGSTTSFGSGGGDLFLIKTDANGIACGNTKIVNSVSGSGGTLGITFGGVVGNTTSVIDITSSSFSSGVVVSVCSAACTLPVASITAGGSTTFCTGSVMLSANSGLGYTYQWRKDGVNINGATSINYLASITGNYSCVVINSCGSNTSNSISVTSGAIPPINVSSNGSPTGNYTFDFCGGSKWICLNSPGDTTGAYNWYHNDSLGLTLVYSGINCVYNSDLISGQWYVSLSTSCGVADANIFVRDISQGNIVSNEFGIVKACSSLQLKTFTYERSWVYWDTYQWKFNGLNIPGATGLHYDATQTGWYGCIVSNSCSTSVSIDSVFVVIESPITAAITAGGSTAICLGSTVTLNANSGNGLTYQWRRNGINISGATSSNYTTGVAGNYTCVVTNTCGSFTSNTISVTVNNPPSITQHPFNGFVCAGSNTSFSVTATGAGLTYQWQENGVNISNGLVFGGATASTLTLTGVPSFYDLSQYRCVVSGTCAPSQTSNSATLSVGATTAPAITITGPSSVCSGSSVNFSAFPMNAGLSPTYEWKKNGVIVTTNILTYSTNSLVNGDVITCTLTNNDPCAPPTPSTSNPITVTVTPLPTASITAGGSTTFCSGGSVLLSANTGAGLSYQWKNNGTNIGGATSSGYTATTTGNYTCVVTNSCGSVTSNSITVTVNSTVAPTITISGPTVICQGASATFTSSITNGGASPLYQWYINGFPVGGATSSSFSSSSLFTGDIISCTLSSSAPCASPATVNSNAIGITVNTVPPATISATGSTTFCQGGSVLLSANTGAGLSYQWKNNGTNIAGATSSGYTATASGNYTCVVTNSCGSTTSNSISVTVNNPPSAAITANGSTTFCTGGSVTLNANTGSGLSYQWKNNGANINGATSSGYTATTPGSYTCVVTNPCGSTTSNSITVSVLSTPATPGAITGQSSGICSITTSYSVTPVAGATSHTWSVPSGVIINSGQGSASINVTYPSNFVSGTIAVYAGNICGNSSTSSLSLTRNLTAPGPISGSTSVCNGNTYSYSIPAVTGATNYNWTIPPKARIISGQGTTLIRVKMNKSAGNVAVVASNACVASSTAVLPVTITTVNCGPVRKSMDLADITIYPNPSNSRFTLSMNLEEETVDVTIRDITGRIVERYGNINPDKFEFGENLISGIYLAEIIYDGERKIIRVVKNN